MNSQETQKLRSLLTRREWAPLIEQLHRLGPTAAADFFMSVPYDEQRALFHEMPIELASSLIVHLPYYHAYVLLHSRPAQDMRNIIDAMSPGERNHFLDALPEEAWQCLMDELAAAGSGAPYCAVPESGNRRSNHGVRARGGGRRTHHSGQANREELSATRRTANPGDRSGGFFDRAQHDHRAAGALRLRQINSAANSFGTCGAFGRRSFVARQTDEPVEPECIHRVSKFRAISVAHGAGKRGGAAAGARQHAFRAASPGAAGSRFGGLARIRIGLSEGTFRRHETARGIRARAGRGTGNPVHGRAVFRARRAYGGESARRVAGVVAGQENSHAQHFHRHAQHRGSGAAGRPHYRSRAQPSENSRGFSRAAAASARPQVGRFCSVRGLHLQSDDAAATGTRASLESGAQREGARRRCCRTRVREASRAWWNC